VRAWAVGTVHLPATLRDGSRFLAPLDFHAPTRYPSLRLPHAARTRRAPLPTTTCRTFPCLLAHARLSPPSASYCRDGRHSSALLHPGTCAVNAPHAATTHCARRCRQAAPSPFALSSLLCHMRGDCSPLPCPRTVDGFVSHVVNSCCTRQRTGRAAALFFLFGCCAALVFSLPSPLWLSGCAAGNADSSC